MVAIAVYVWFRFEWQFGVGALIAMLHDVISTLGVFVLFQLDFSLTALAAVLTIAGYSINDTVVIFDRVRENMRRYKKMRPDRPAQPQRQRDPVAHLDDLGHGVRGGAGAGPVRRPGALQLLGRHAVGRHRRHLLVGLGRLRGLVYLGLRPDQLRPPRTGQGREGRQTEQAA